MRLQRFRGSRRLSWCQGASSMKPPVASVVAVGEGNIGLDVKDGRSVAQVGAQHVNNRAVVGELDRVVDFDAGQSNGVGAEWTSGLRTLPCALIRPKRGGLTVGDAFRVRAAFVVGGGICCKMCCAVPPRRAGFKFPKRPVRASSRRVPRRRYFQRELGLENDAPPQCCGARKLLRGMPNFWGRSVRICAMGFMLRGLLLWCL